MAITSPSASAVRSETALISLCRNKCYAYTAIPRNGTKTAEMVVGCGYGLPSKICDLQVNMSSMNFINYTVITQIIELENNQFTLVGFVFHYQEYLRNLIENAVKACPRSLFIFDMMEYMPVGLIDAIKPYMGYYNSPRGIDYRKATFLFLRLVTRIIQLLVGTRCTCIRCQET